MLLCFLRERAERTERSHGSSVQMSFWCGGGGGVEVAGRGWSLDGRVQGMLLATATACAIVLFCNISELLAILPQ